MKNLREQTDAKIAEGRLKNPDFMKGVDAVIEEAKTFEQGGNAIKVGEKAPKFKLPNARGKSVSLDNLLENGPVVISFYRGDWCPYCNLQIKALQDILSDIHDLGANLVAISPQVPDESLSIDEISKMDFGVLSDQDAKVAFQYGVAWEVPEFLAEHMREDRGLDLEQINNGNATMLPIPATFVLNREGVVKWSFVDVDYRKRSEPSDIIKALKSLF
ncbi:alkyl hydroperoxide reductase [Formosa agariphila KMM 3901]|uniref:thioredoxin-dependent peroxiredoxin n=1 Tax=Formosa agariphila (strain DSM 15362 / KCTC 12365 / LMG 23005 / KMM 3901 / M-2Alg 35-1) TaxID=1347342 RepID=T2KLQ2_FORAG|nr:peroxiredoxin-like family protein [Formosa agariphila]CDF79356.1 alkyl hydroperoxide reductase [Formosa agariphila KMM 3901]